MWICFMFIFTFWKQKLLWHAIAKVSQVTVKRNTVIHYCPVYVWLETIHRKFSKYWFFAFTTYFFCWHILPPLYKTFKIFTIMQHWPEWRRFSSGMIKIAFTLSETNLFITFAIKFGEGTNQLFSSVQLALKASTHSVSGNQYFELNLTHFLF